MAHLPVWKVTYGFEVAGRLATEVKNDIVQAADNSYNTLKTALLTNNARQTGPGTLAIYGVSNVSPGNGGTGIA